MRRRHLLLMTNSVAIGGMEEHVRLIAREIDRERYSVTSCFPRWQATDGWAPRLAEVSDELVRITPDRRHGTTAWLREVAKLWRLAREQRFDVAHLHGTSYHGMTVTILVLRTAGVRRLFLTEHLAPYEPQHRWRRVVRRAVCRLLTGLVSVSEYNRTARTRNLGNAGCPAIVVNNGIDVKRFDDIGDLDADVRSELRLEPDRLVVGTAIRLESDKGVDDLIRAFAEVVEGSHPGAILLIVGDGSHRSALESLTAELGIADSVRFAGFQPAPYTLIRAMDVFVLPVPVGSASIGLLEAMALRRPCIITFGEGREAVVHGESGLDARPHDPASIARFIIELLDSRSRRERMGDAAYRRVHEEYSAASMVHRLQDLYTSDQREWSR